MHLFIYLFIIKIFCLAKYSHKSCATNKAGQFGQFQIFYYIVKKKGFLYTLWIA